MFGQFYNLIYETFLGGVGSDPTWNLDILAYLLTFVLMIILFVILVKLIFGTLAIFTSVFRL